MKACFQSPTSGRSPECLPKCQLNEVKMKIEKVLEDGISDAQLRGDVQEIVDSFIPKGGLVALEPGIVIYDPGLSVNSEGGLLTPQGLGLSAESEQISKDDKKAQIEDFNERIREIKKKMAKIINFNEEQNN